MNKEEAKLKLIEDGFDVERLVERELYVEDSVGVFTPEVIERLVIVKGNENQETVFRFRFYGIKWEGVISDMNHFHHVFKRANQPDNQPNKDVHWWLTKLQIWIGL